ncbi:MAG: oxygenase MpaB family protein, partial [Pseudomonadota bacterium]
MNPASLDLASQLRKFTGVSLPSRALNVDLAHARHGATADALLEQLWVSDPLADAVVQDFADRRGSWAQLDRALKEGIDAVTDAPASLGALFEQLDEVPSWVSWDRIERGGQLLFRTAMAGGITLGAKSLCYGYCSPGGNKPLAFTGQLDGPAVGRRLAETGRFVTATCTEGGLRRFGEGFAATVKVRLMHAQVRRLLQQAPEWRSDLWGTPINQHDTVATSLLFSSIFIEGVRQFGFWVSRREAEDFLHLWKYSGYLIGAPPELLPNTEAEAEVIADIITMTQGPPDEDSRRLVESLIHSPEAAASNAEELEAAQIHVNLGYGFCHTLLGEEICDQLELRRSPWRWAIPTARVVVGALEPLRRFVPRVDAAYRNLGQRYWATTVEVGLAGQPARFAPPTSLGAVKEA